MSIRGRHILASPLILLSILLLAASATAQICARLLLVLLNAWPQAGKIFERAYLYLPRTPLAP